MKKILALLSLALMLTFVRTPAFAQAPVACDQSYTVTAGDWLSKLAEKYYGSASAYGAIATQTNLKSETDFAYATVVNPDSIQVGWKLCLPNQETANALNGVNAPAGLDKTALGNATYTGVMDVNDSYTLKDGHFSEQAVPDSPMMTDVMLTDQIAYGDLNGVPSAAVIIGATGGGSGYFYSLHIMQAQDGKPVQVATIGLGDRSPVIALVVRDNQTQVDMITQGPDQPMCCGSLRVVNWFALEGKELKLANQKELGYLGPNGETPGQPLAVTGDVIYRERIAMPPGAVVKVQVADVSKQDVAADVIGEQVIENPGNVPVKFAVPYDAGKIEAGLTYAVSARIEVDGKLQWISTTRIPVITNGAPTSGVEVLVQKVGDAPTPPANDAAQLVGPVWQWQGTTTPKEEIKVADPSRYTITFNADGSANIKNDCNNILATYKIDGSSLQLELGPTTLMACPPDTQDAMFSQQLSAVRIYSFKDGVLLLDLFADAGTMKFAK